MCGTREIVPIFVALDNCLVLNTSAFALVRCISRKVYIVMRDFSWVTSVYPLEQDLVHFVHKLWLRVTRNVRWCQSPKSLEQEDGYFVMTIDAIFCVP